MQGERQTEDYIQCYPAVEPLVQGCKQAEQYISCNGQPFPHRGGLACGMEDLEVLANSELIRASVPNAYALAYSVYQSCGHIAVRKSPLRAQGFSEPGG